MDLQNHWLVTIALVTSSLIAISANFLLLLVFLRRRGLRTASNRFVINLLFINLLSSLLLVPFLIVDKEAGRPKLEDYNVSTAEIVEEPNAEIIVEKERHVINGTLFESLLIENRSLDSEDLEVIEANFSVNIEEKSDSFCLVSQFSLNFICTASILSILLIGIDQYIAVLHPLRCHSYINKTKSMILIILSWTVSSAFAATTSTLKSNANFFKNVCPPIEKSPTNLIYSTTYFIFIIFLPFALICLIYVLIYNAAHKNSSRIRKTTNINSLEEQRSFPKVQSAPNLNKVNEMQELAPKVVTITRTNSERPPRTLMTSLRTKISNASVFRYREESRTAKISILVIFMVLICYVPYGLLFILNTFTGDLEVFNQTSLLLLISSNILSPVLFAYRNRRVQRELKKFLNGLYVKDEIGARPKIVVNQIRRDVEEEVDVVEPFLEEIEVKVEAEKKSILKRVCSKNWTNYKKCSFIAVPDSCLDARGSFSSASTQISTED